MRSLFRFVWRLKTSVRRGVVKCLLGALLMGSLICDSRAGATTNASSNFPSLKEVRQKWDVQSIEAVQRAAEAGELTAQHYLAFCYASGERVQKDGGASVRWYERAGAAGYLPSFINLGLLYKNGEVVPRDYSQAFQLTRRAADAGLSQGQINLGFLYRDGVGVPSDLTEAVKWWRLAAAQGHTSAMVEIGRAYRNGQGVQQDSIETIKWFKQAAAAGDALGELNLGSFYEYQGDLDSAHKFYQLAAEHGSADAMWVMHNLYENGIGVTKDWAEAERWLLKGAEAGSARAQTSLGNHHESPYSWTSNRIGDVRVSMAEAVRWYRRAADQNWADGQYRLASCYLEGKGVEMDEERGLDWMRAAADQDLPKALVELSELYFHGVGQPRSHDDEPMSLLRRAEKIKSKGSYGVYNRPYDLLILRCEHGIGTPRDLVAAAEWFVEASMVGVYNYSLEDKLEYAPSKRRAQWGGTGIPGYSLVTIATPGGSGPSDSLSEILSNYLKATQAGGGTNAWRIAERYRVGRDVPASKPKAWAWFGIATERGHSEAVARRKVVEGDLSPQELMDARQVFEQLRAQLARAKQALP